MKYIPLQRKPSKLYEIHTLSQGQPVNYKKYTPLQGQHWNYMKYIPLQGQPCKLYEIHTLIGTTL